MSKKGIKGNFFLISLVVFLFFTNIKNVSGAKGYNDEVVWRGITFSDVTPELAQQLGLFNQSGVIITNISPDSPASGKLTVESVILEVNRQSIKNTSEFMNVVDVIPESKPTMVRVYADGRYSYLIIPGSDESKKVTETSRAKEVAIKEKTQSADFSVRVNSESEIIPMILQLLKSPAAQNARIESQQTEWIGWEITNNTNERVQITTKTEILTWCPPINKQVTVEPKETFKFGVTPFDLKLFQCAETTPASLFLEAKINDRIIFQDTRDIKIYSAETMMWMTTSQGISCSFLIAHWVTPNDPLVGRVLSQAKEILKPYPGESLCGYQSKNIYRQVQAIFNALRNTYEIKYVNSPVSFEPGMIQRVRLPKTSIGEGKANCIDGAVLMASLFEAIGLEPCIVFTPGHAFVGVNAWEGSKEKYFIETTTLLN